MSPEFLRVKKVKKTRELMLKLGIFQCWQSVFCLFCFVFLLFFRASPMAYGGSQNRGRIGATAASLRHSHSNAGFKLHLGPTPQLTATLDAQPTE